VPVLFQYFLNGNDVYDLIIYVDYKTEGGCLPGFDEASVSVGCVVEFVDPKDLTHLNLDLNTTACI
jgi:hypothetical protein